jgi:hypothetical protein
VINNDSKWHHHQPLAVKGAPVLDEEEEYNTNRQFVSKIISTPSDHILVIEFRFHSGASIGSTESCLRTISEIVRMFLITGIQVFWMEQSIKKTWIGTTSKQFSRGLRLWKGMNQPKHDRIYSSTIKLFSCLVADHGLLSPKSLSRSVSISTLVVDLPCFTSIRPSLKDASDLRRGSIEVDLWVVRREMCRRLACPWTTETVAVKSCFAFAPDHPARCEIR